MYSTKDLVIGLMIGMVVGATNTFVQKTVKDVCNSSKQVIMTTKECCMNGSCKYLDDMKRFVNKNIDNMKDSFNRFSSTLSKEELNKKFNEMIFKVESLFQEFTQGFKM